MHSNHRARWRARALPSRVLGYWWRTPTHKITSVKRCNRSFQSSPPLCIWRQPRESADGLRPMNGPPCCCPPRRRWPISGDIPSCITIVLATCKGADEETHTPTMWDFFHFHCGLRALLEVVGGTCKHQCGSTRRAKME